MARNQTWYLLLVTSLALMSGSRYGWADSPAPRPAPSEFDKMISRIRSAEADRAWQRPGWKDDVIEATLKKAIAAAKTSAERESLKLPIDFTDVKPFPPNVELGFLVNNLVVAAGTVDVAHANKSIFLVDGNIRIAHAYDCVVVARGFADLSHCERCVVIAGHHINVSFDGIIGDGGPSMTSLFISGRSIGIAHAEGTICSAPEWVSVSHAKNMDFLASPNRDISHHEGCKFKDKANSPLAMALPMDVPASLFKVRQVCDAESDPARQLVTVEKNGLEYVLRLGSKITDEKGQPIPSWDKWSVSFISERIVLFSDGQSDMSARERLPGQ
jgi:hypothetical protein